MSFFEIKVSKKNGKKILSSAKNNHFGASQDFAKSAKELFNNVLVSFKKTQAMFTKYFLINVYIKNEY